MNKNKIKDAIIYKQLCIVLYRVYTINYFAWNHNEPFYCIESIFDFHSYVILIHIAELM